MEIILYLEKNCTLFGNLAVATLSTIFCLIHDLSKNNAFQKVALLVFLATELVISCVFWPFIAVFLLGYDHWIIMSVFLYVLWSHTKGFSFKCF